MAVINSFDPETTKRLSAMILAGGAALTFSAFNLLGAAVSVKNVELASKISNSFYPLMSCLMFAAVSYASAVLAGHPDMPEEGHPWSKRNFLETAFALGILWGVILLGWATYELFGAAWFAATASPSKG